MLDMNNTDNLTNIPSSFSAYELYAAFLLVELPKLETVGINAPRLGRYGTLEYAIEYAGRRDGLNLEFGVFQGESLRLCADRFPSKHFYGFDSFSGFPEDGRSDWDHDFAVSNLPEVPKNCELVAGYFEDTLDRFLSDHNQAVNFVNIDCDIYSSTRTILSCLSKHGKLKGGVVLHFDELINYEEYLWNEMLALFECLVGNKMSVEWLFCHRKIYSLEETIGFLRSGKYPTWQEHKALGYRQQATGMLADKPLDFGILQLPQIVKRVSFFGGQIKRLTRKRFPEKVEVFDRIEAFLPTENG